MSYLAHTVFSSNGRFTIYGLTDNINHFLSTNLTPDQLEGPENFVVQRPGSRRRQYPGDTSPVDTRPTTATVLRDPSAKDGGSALPGRPFVLESISGLDANGGLVVDERRQFHLRGDIISLHAFLTSSAAGPVRLISSRGRKYRIKFDELSEE